MAMSEGEAVTQRTSSGAEVDALSAGLLIEQVLGHPRLRHAGGLVAVSLAAFPQVRSLVFHGYNVF
jgi:hypothetical protein